MPYHIEGNNNHNGDGSLPKQQQKEEQLLHPHHTGVIIRSTLVQDIPKIVNLQQESFPYLARYGNIWRPEELESHLRVFPESQFVALIRL
jgi:hypothetical protein